MSLRSRDPYLWLTLILVGTLTLLVVFFAYIRTFINNTLFLSEVSVVASVCDVEGQESARKKLVYFNKLKGEAHLYCLYSDESKNNIIYINRVDGDWQLSRQVKFLDSDEFYWPFYN